MNPSFSNFTADFNAYYQYNREDGTVLVGKLIPGSLDGGDYDTNHLMNLKQATGETAFSIPVNKLEKIDHAKYCDLVGLLHGIDIQPLHEQLLEQTQELKKQYLQKTAEWAVHDLARLQDIVRKFRSGCCYHHNQTRTRFIKEGSQLISQNEYYRMARLVDRVKGKVRIHHPDQALVKAEWVERKVKAAEQHYQNSILKLAGRIEKKGLNLDTIEMKTSSVDVNISTQIVDGDGNQVRAWTIVASGPIQRPHYRYLIK